MFSNFLSHVTSFKSPKTLLASFLASSLGEFFVVDPAQIESNLLSDTKIVLTSLVLKKLSAGTLWVDGTVDEVEFSWVWGGDDNSPFIRETLVTIRGARFRAFCSADGDDETNDDQDVVDPPASTAKCSNQRQTPEGGVGYMQRQVQQVIDHLTLNIVDLELVIDIPTPKDALVVQAKALCLASHGREENGDYLSQRISVDSVAAFIRHADCDQAFPFLDIIGYAATVTRISGRRFVDGFLSGIEIVGEVLDSGELFIHLGCQQAQVANRLVEMLMENSSALPVCAPGGAFKVNDDTVRTENDANESTSVVLPLPSLKVLFPDNNQVQMPGCTFHYRMDGSICRLNGTEGINLNKDFMLLHIEKDCVWCLDVATSTISIRQSASNFQHAKQTIEDEKALPKIAHIHWHEVQVKRFMKSLQDVSKATSVTALQKVGGAVKREVEAWQVDNVDTTWKILLEGCVSIRIEGEKFEWIDARVEATSVKLTTSGLLRQMNLGPVMVGPTSFGAMSLRIPAGEFVKESNTLHFRHMVLASAVSKSTVEHFINVLQRVADFTRIDGTSHVPDNTPLTALPFNLLIQQVKVTIAQPNTGLLVANTMKVLEKGDISIESLQFKSDQDSTVAQAVEVTFSPTEMSGSVGQIRSLEVANIFSLPDPVNDVSVIFAEEVLQVTIDLLHVAICLNTKQHKKELVKTAGINPISLPFPLRLQVEKLRLSPLEIATSLCIRSLDISICQDGDSLVVETGLTKLRLETSNEDWISAILGKSRAVLSQSVPGHLTLRELENTGVSLGPSSFGHCTVCVPTIEMKNDMVHIPGKVEVELASQEVAHRIQDFVQNLISELPDLSPSSSHANSLPRYFLPLSIAKMSLDLRAPQVFLICQGVNLKESLLQCQSLSVSEASGISSTLSGLQAALDATGRVTARAIETFHVPETFVLEEASQDPDFTFLDGILQVNLTKTNIVLSAQRQQTPLESSSNPLPFHVQIRIPVLNLRIEGSPHFSVEVENLDVAAVPVDGAISIETSGEISFTAKSTYQQWAKANINSPSAVLSPTKSGWSLCSMSFNNFHLGPTTVGHVAVDIFAVHIPVGSNEINVGSVYANIQSPETIEHLQSLLDPFFHYMSSTGKPTIAYQVKMPKVVVETSEPLTVHFLASNACVSSDAAYCEQVVVSEKSGAAATISGINAILQPSYALTVDWVEALYVPGAFSLDRPLQSVHIFYDTALCRVKIPNLHLTMFPSPNGTSAHTERELTIPFPVHLSFDEIGVKLSPSSVDYVSIRQIEVKITTKVLDPFVPQEQQCKGFELSVSAALIENEMGHLEMTRISAQVLGKSLNEIPHLQFSARTGTIVSGFSRVDWSTLLKGGETADTVIVNLPLCCVEPMDLHLEFKGIVVGTTTSVRVPKFVGGPKTTSIELGQHFINAILSKAPSFITNAEIMGNNTSEIAGQMAGRMAMGSSAVLGSMGGSVTGLVAVDGVRAAIASGKKYRGASDHDGYKFGDFTRGSLRAIGQSTKSGAELRGEDSGRYKVGDFSAGAATSTGKYVSDNKGRIGAAGGSGIGMVVGLALMGPVGIIAGSIAGSKAGGTVFKNDGDEKAKRKSQASEQARSDSAVVAESDLLGMSTPAHNIESGIPQEMPAFSSAPVVHISKPSPSASQFSYTNHSQNAHYSAQAQPINNQGHYGGRMSGQQRSIHLEQQQMQLLSVVPPSNQDFFSSFGPATISTQQQPIVTATPVDTSADAYLDISIPQLGGGHGGQHQPYYYQQQTQSAGVATQQQHQPQQQNYYHTPDGAQQHQHPQRQEATQPQGYRFGDLTKSVVSRGKKNDGRKEKDGYKFGDFTRGLFGS